MSFYVSVEGAVGAGKMTLLQEIEKNLSPTKLFNTVCIIEEPVAAFYNYKGECNPFYLNYKQPEKNMTMTQLHIIHCVANHFDFEVKRVGKEALILSERSPLVSQIFVNNCYSNVCLRRIGMRNRDGEQVLNKLWLSLLNMEYNCFLTE